jgi:hypothetical protein
MKAPLKHLLKIMLLLGLSVFSVPLLSAEYNKDRVHSESKSGRVILFVFDNDFADETSAIRAIRAGLSDLNVVMEVRQEEGASQNMRSLSVKAQKLTEESGAIIAFRCQTVGQRLLHLYRPKEGGGVFETRAIESTSEESTTEMMAVIIRRTIIEAMAQSESPAEHTFARDADAPEIHGAGAVGVALIPQKKTKDGTSDAIVEENGATERLGGKEEESKIEERSSVDEREEKVTREQFKREAWVTVEQRDELETARKRFFLEAALGLKVQSTEHPTVVGGNFLVGTRLYGQLCLFAGYTWESPTEDTLEDSLKLVLTRHPLEVGLRYRIPIQRIRLGLSLALMMDIVTKDVQLSSPTFDVEDDDIYTEWSMVPMLKISYPFNEYLSAVAGLGFKIVMNEERFYVELEDKHKIIHDSWPIQLLIHLGLSFAPI